MLTCEPYKCCCIRKCLKPCGPSADTAKRLAADHVSQGGPAKPHTTISKIMKSCHKADSVNQEDWNVAKKTDP